MKKAASATQKKTSPKNVLKGQKSLSLFFAKAAPGNSSESQKTRNLPCKPTVTENFTGEGSNNKRKVTDSSDLAQKKLRKLSSKNDEFREPNALKKSDNDNDVLDFLREEGLSNTKHSENARKNYNARKTKENILATEKESPRKNSFDIASGGSPVRDNASDQAQKINSAKKQMSPLKTESQNVRVSAEEEKEILKQLLASEAQFSLDKAASGEKQQLEKKRPSRKVFSESKLDKRDEKLLNKLLSENSKKLQEAKLEKNTTEKSVHENVKVESDVVTKESVNLAEDFLDAFAEEFVFEDDDSKIEKKKTKEDLQKTEMNCEFDDFFTDDWGAESGTETDLSTLQRCEVIDVRDGNRGLIVELKPVEAEATATVTCMGFWRDMKIKPGEFVSIQATNRSDGWIVDNNAGFVVTQPDTLVSGTAVVGALFCARRGVLSDRFKGIETMADGKQDSSIVMTIGSLVHELLQEVLGKKIYDLPGMNKLLREMLRSRHTIEMLYSAGMTLDECRKQMSPFVPKISEFVELYVTGKRKQKKGENFNGSIETVHDIEENIWMPKLGVKGKVDATVEVKLNSRRRIMPLELKTGRASFSLEHRGQVILYTMMMAETGQEVDSGLLLYLKENEMREIKVGHPERRDLILLRNNLAYYLTLKPQHPEEKDSLLESQENLELMQLPEPINHRACERCPYSTLCCAYLSRDKNYQLPESHPLTIVSQGVLACLKPQHIDYVTKWATLLQIEEAAQASGSELRNIWTKTPLQREKKGKSISCLKVSGPIVEECGRFAHTFVREKKDEPHAISDLSHSGFTVQEYVIVSTDTRINISAGPVIEICEDSITLLLDRDITKRNPRAVFHIDTYSSQSLLSFNLTNIGCLLDDTENSERLRKIVIDRESATFSTKLARSVAVTCADVLQRLNKIQQRAVLKVLTSDKYLLIKGMPGTGKTQTLVALIELLVKLGKSVLVTSHTHSAVDNVLLRLAERDIDFLRLGAAAKVHALLKHKGERVLTENCDSPESLHDAYSSKNVVGVTCLGSHHPLLGKRMFDVCVVDESTQVLQPTILRPLYSAKKFVLIGDPDQLPPVVRSNKARELGMDESLFSRLDKEENTVILSLQYRMNNQIMSVANDLTYRGLLRAGSESVANATLNIPDKTVLDSCELWVKKTLSPELEDSVIMLNTGNTRNWNSSEETEINENKEERKCSNLKEAAIVLHLTTCLLKMGVAAENIGVIAPYRAQVILLKKTVEKSIEVNTVDQYQGRDKDIILFSCAKSTNNSEPRNLEREFEILEDQRRLTVAITRSRHKLVVIGDSNTLKSFTPFKKLISCMREKNIVNLTEGSEDFYWKKLPAPVR